MPRVNEYVQLHRYVERTPPGSISADGFMSVTYLLRSTCLSFDVLWPMACGLWPMAYGSWPMPCGLRPTACGLWPMAYGLRPTAYGGRFVVCSSMICYGLWAFV